MALPKAKQQAAAQRQATVERKSGIAALANPKVGVTAPPTRSTSPNSRTTLAITPNTPTPTRRTLELRPGQTSAPRLQAAATPAAISSSRSSSSSSRRPTTLAAPKNTTPLKATLTPGSGIIDDDENTPAVNRNLRTRNKAAEDQALADSLKSGAEGGANNSMPMGTDIPGKLNSDPGFRKMLQESINMRAYGTARPEFADETAPAVTTQTPGTGPDMQLHDDMGAGGFDLDGMKKRFGLDADTEGRFTAPDTSKIDSQLDEISDEQFSLETAKADFDAQVASIKSKYDAQRQAAQAEAENRAGERFAELAALGTNPSSSAGASIENEKRMLMQKFMSQIAIAESEEMSAATSEYNEQRNTAITAKMDYLTKKKAGIKDDATAEYNRKREALQDSISVLNATLSAATSAKALSQTDKDNATNSLKTMFSLFGSSAFDGVSDDDLRKLEQSTGLPMGTLKAGMAGLKAAEAEAKKLNTDPPELREVNGSLYQMWLNPTTGLYEPKLVIAKAGGGTGGGGTGLRNRSMSQSQIDQAAEMLRQSKGADGYVNTQLYKDILAGFAVANGSTGQKEFKTYFPPSVLLNPVDPTAAPVLGIDPTSTRVYGESGSSTGSVPAGTYDNIDM